MSRMKCLIAVGAAVAATIAFPTVATAGTASSQTSCSTSSNLGNRICVDMSAQTVYIYSDGVSVYRAYGMWETLGTSGALSVSTGWIAWDFECSGGTYTTTMPTPYSNYSTSYGGVPLHPFGYVYQPGEEGFEIDQTGLNLVAWFANSNSGFECLVVP